MSNFVQAALHNKVDEVERMLATENISQEEALEALNEAGEYGNTDVVRAILKAGRFDPTNTTALRSAASSGFTEIVEMLLKDGRVDPMGDFNSAMIYAAQNGHLPIIKLFLADDRVGPTYVPPKRPGILKERMPVIDEAYVHEHMDIVKELARDPRVFKALKKGNQSYKYVKNYLEHEHIIGSAMAFRNLEISAAPYRLPPYVLAQILSENVTAYNLHDIVTTITPILQPTMEGDDGERVKRPPQKLKRRKI